MAKEIEAICAAKLREIRRKKGLTLHAFEALSGGEIKAVVLGSYERGTRAVSLERLEKLAELYEVPIQFFFGLTAKDDDHSQKRFIFDLRRIGKRNELPEHLNRVKKYISTIAKKRSDWNGEVISLRESDSESLSLICDLNSEDLKNELKLNGFLFATQISGQHSP